MAPPGKPPSIPVVSGTEGPATVATYSTTYGREGPQATALICDLPDGTRAYARMEDPPDDDDDLCGTTVHLAAGKRGAHTATR